LTHPNQLASHVSKKRELWLAFSDLDLGLQRRHITCLYLEILD